MLTGVVYNQVCVLGLIVKRAEKDENGQWLLVSDHPAWEPVPWGDAQMIGEVKWMARTL